MYARILEILDQNSKKNFAGCNGLRIFWEISMKLDVTYCDGLISDIIV